ncbi:MAG: GDP-L-fucose synthase [Minisyncoccia bacterium]
MKKTSKIYVAGHNGLVGSAIVRTLKKKGYTNLLLRTRKELNLLDQKAVEKFFFKEKPEYVFLAAAKVGGIMANKTYPADFIYENIVVESNIIHSSYVNKIKKLLFLGSVCIYPKFTPTPVKEESLLTGPLEPTNKPYALAKIAGINMCQSYNNQYGTNFISIMPTNLYGPNDNFDLNNSHVLPALMRKFYEAKEKGLKEVTVWGTGKARREFMHVDDLADACVFLMNKYNQSEIINIGLGSDQTIKTSANLIKKITEFKGKIVWDTSKPDGTPKRRLDVKKIHTLGWKHKIGLEEGLKKTYEWYIKNRATLRK